MSNVTNEFVLTRLKEHFESSIISSDLLYDVLTVEINSEKLHEIIAWLKNDEVLKMSFLTLIGAVHYPQQVGRELCVNYHVHSLVHNFRLRLRVYVPIEQPNVDSITDIYVGANWLERETYDFFGVNFVGHPNLVRILNEDSMDYFPMRKEFHLEDATREDKDDRYFGR